MSQLRARRSNRSRQAPARLRGVDFQRLTIDTTQSDEAIDTSPAREGETAEEHTRRLGRDRDRRRRQRQAEEQLEEEEGEEDQENIDPASLESPAPKRKRGRPPKNPAAAPQPRRQTTGRPSGPPLPRRTVVPPLPPGANPQQRPLRLRRQTTRQVAAETDGQLRANQGAAAADADEELNDAEDDEAAPEEISPASPPSPPVPPPQCRPGRRLALRPAFRVARQPIVDENDVPYCDIGGRTYTCSHCNARLWKDERSRTTLCCSGGKTHSVLSTVFAQAPPEPIDSLFRGAATPTSRQFRNNIRSYNNQLTMTSAGMKEIPPPGNRGISMLRIQGAMHHFAGPAAPAAGQVHQFMQVYMIDNEADQLQARIINSNGRVIDQQTLAQLQTCLLEYNSCVRAYKQAMDFNSDEYDKYTLVFRQNAALPLPPPQQQQQQQQQQALNGPGAPRQPGAIVPAVPAANQGPNAGAPLQPAVFRHGNVEVERRPRDPHVYHERRYNAPVEGNNEIAAFIPGAPVTETVDRKREIQLLLRAPEDGRGLVKISDLNPLYTPLRYPLLYPRGETGWHYAMKTASGKNISPTQYAVYLMNDRNPVDFSVIIHSARLFQEWLVDHFVISENSKLSFLRHNQAKLRSEVYQGLSDAVAAGETDAANIGRATILPSTFVGGPRHMQQSYQDAMGLVRQFGKPDLFVTKTCNPDWEEIKRELKPGQSANDRPDLIARVFKQKVDALKEDILKNGIFGKAVAHVYVIEFQKRGLPHAHFLIFLAHEDTPFTPEEIDSIVCAELPDKTTHPMLHQLVTKHMLHGPCGEACPTCPCMKQVGEQRTCSKQFPKAFQEHTTIPADGFPSYRRREGATYRKTPTSFTFDNRWVVPYNAWLLIRYQCHINVEICNTVQAVKYLFKYITKGQDRAEVAVVPAAGDAPPGQVPAGAGGDAMPQARDEIKEFVDGRYVCACEAAWHLLGFGMHSQSPPITRLPVHLPAQQIVTFNVDNGLDAALAAARKDTPLTAFFEFNRVAKMMWQLALATNPAAPKPVALDKNYPEFPTIAVWDQKEKVWKERRRGTAASRIYYVNPSDVERYALRLLLCHVPGPTSFAYLRTTVNTETRESVQHATFQAACLARGLLQDDSEWEQCLEDVNIHATPAQLRGTFVDILAYNAVSNALELWEKFKEPMTEDYLHRAKLQNPQREFDDQLFGQTLRELDRLLLNCGNRKSARDFGLPVIEMHRLPGVDYNAQEGHALIDDEKAKYPVEQQQEIRDRVVPLLNEGQRNAFGPVVEKALAGQVNLNGNNVFFLDGLAGGGKTFTYGAMAAAVRAEGHVAICVASSGLAAQLLPGGTTAHSRFKLPVAGLSATSPSYISKQSGLAELIRTARLIIWDEAPMMHRHLFELLDRTLRDIMSKVNPQLEHVPFGGKVIVMGGDFRQLLPVVPRGTKSMTVDAALKSSSLWQHVQVLLLHENMRVKKLQEEGASEETVAKFVAFSDFLLALGNGTAMAVNEDAPEGYVTIPKSMCCTGETLKDLISDVYGGLEDCQSDAELKSFLKARAILTPLTADVDEINYEMNMKMDLKANALEEGAEEGVPAPIRRKVYLSADSAASSEHERSQRRAQQAAANNNVQQQQAAPNGQQQEGQQQQLAGHIYPVEYLNTLNFSGVPPHRLCIQVGSPIILLRNLSNGLANGTRLMVKRLMDRAIEAEVLTGPREGETVFITRLTITPSDVDSLPFVLRRRQFPIRPAYAITINKAQGQTLECVGVYLPKDVFAHGQLYVGISRVGDENRIFVLSPRCAPNEDGISVMNVVYQEVLT